MKFLKGVKRALKIASGLKFLKPIAKIALKTAPIWSSFIPGGSIAASLIGKGASALAARRAASKSRPPAWAGADWGGLVSGPAADAALTFDPESGQAGVGGGAPEQVLRQPHIAHHARTIHAIHASRRALPRVGRMSSRHARNPAHRMTVHRHIQAHRHARLAEKFYRPARVVRVRAMGHRTHAHHAIHTMRARRRRVA